MKENLKILIVDDEPSFASYIATLLTDDFGIENVQIYHNATKAFEEASNLTDQCDLILSDMKMPQMSGIDLLRKIKTDDRTAKIPFVLFSSYFDPGLQELAFVSGASGVIDKFSLPSELSDFLKRFAEI